MTGDCKVERVFYKFLNFHNSWIAEFKDLFCVCADHMIMLTKTMRLFI